MATREPAVFVPTTGAFVVKQSGAVRPRQKSAHEIEHPTVIPIVDIPVGGSVTFSCSAGTSSGLTGSYSLSAKVVRGNDTHVPGTPASEVPGMVVSGFRSGANPVGGKADEFVLTVGDEVPPGTYRLLVEANDGKVTKTSEFTLHVLDPKVPAVKTPHPRADEVEPVEPRAHRAHL